MSKIVFFNHYHRGDLLTHKEFARQIKQVLGPQGVEFEYMHFNHPKLTRDIDIPLVGDPSNLDPKTPFYQTEDTLYVNTWIGCFWDIFCTHGGINMNSLWHQWEKIYQTINECFGTDIKLSQRKEDYLPKIDFTVFNISNIDNYLKENKEFKKILICNGAPKSGQSFADNMKQFVEPLSEEFPKIHFIMTEKFSTDRPNIKFTDDIVGDTEVVDKRAPWEDREVNNCDVQEISYISENCDAIVGKNSGPYVFCETYNNYMDPKKKFLSYNVSWGIGKPMTETMSNGLPLKASYKIQPVEGPAKGDLDNLTADDIANINNSLHSLAESL
jgi:hypothetical protein